MSENYMGSQNHGVLVNYDVSNMERMAVFDWNKHSHMGDLFDSNWTIFRFKWRTMDSVVYNWNFLRFFVALSDFKMYN